MVIRKKSEGIREFILSRLAAHKSDIASVTAQNFGISRAAVAKHLSRLVDENIITASGNTKARRYEFVYLVRESMSLKVDKQLQEDVVWREKVSPLLGEHLEENVRLICNYGFTEMLNNVVDHSGSKQVTINIERTAVKIIMWVRDYGIGIFNKLMKDFGYTDPRHAMLELCKGKLTSDAKHHSGEGIFFTSRMFDDFMLASGNLDFIRFNRNDDWLFETKPTESLIGTLINMEISPRATQTTTSVFNQYASELNEYGFTRTHIPLELARYEGEQLVSRSQARRLLARVEQFKEVCLNFKDIKIIGQGFADEIFRVFAQAHPEVRFVTFGTNTEIDNMIKHVRSGLQPNTEPELPFEGMSTV